MMHLVTGSPGLGKTSLVVSKLDKVEKNNKVNLKKNLKSYQKNLEIFADYQQEFLHIIKETGSGHLLKSEVELLDSDYFDIFSKEYDDLRPDDYYAKSVIYNTICQRICDDYGIHSYYKLEPVRTIYTNINALKIDYVRSLELLRNSEGKIDWRLAPDGSIIVIDEIQLVEPYKHVKLKDEPIIEDMTVHRHRGFDFYIITQSTNYINVNMRDLFGVHYHVTKPFGLSTSVYHYGGFRSNPDTKSSKKTAEQRLSFNPPARIFKLYKSTTINTHKKRIPWKMVLIFGGLLSIGLSMILYGFFGGVSKSSYINPDSKESVNDVISNATNLPMGKESDESIVFVEQMREINELKNKIEIQKLMIEYNDTFIQQQLLRLQSERLSPTYKAVQKDDDIRVAGVMIMAGKCVAYNKFGDSLNIDNQECISYQKDNKIVKARLDSSSSSSIGLPNSFEQ